MNKPHPAEALGNGKSRALATWDSFQAELKAHEHEIATLLPRHVSRERFMSSAVAAVKQNPDLLKATPRSLFQAITQSAQDGLLPDGREGVITVYNERVGKGPNASYEKRAKWNPMTWGLRKRARELEHLIVDCQVVHAGDHFVWHQGDEPRLEHIPAALGTPRGDMIGAYAIFKNEAGILHREVMDANQIAKVRGQSKNADGLLWTKFAEEGWKKTVLRRGIKSVPCTEVLQRIVERDDDSFQFEENGSHKQIEAPPPPPKVSEKQAQISDTKPEVEDAQIAAEPFSKKELTDYMADLEARYEQAEGRSDIEEIKADAEENAYPRMLPMDTPKAERLYQAALERLNG